MNVLSRKRRKDRASLVVRLPMERLPQLRKGTSEEHALIALRLGLLKPTAVESAAVAGYLWLADIPNPGGPTTAWIVTDSSRQAAEMRHLSGPAFRDPMNGRLDRVVFGDSQWPIGANSIKSGVPVVLARGAEDIIAALPIMWGFSVVGMLDDGRISEVALPLFNQHMVVLAELADPAAQPAFAVWRDQLISHAVFVQRLSAVERDGRRYYLNGAGKTARNLLDWAIAGYPAADGGR